jgi:rhodanese-related sulfurtransferase
LGLSIKSKLNREKARTESVETIVTHADSKLVVKDGVHRDLETIKEGTYPHVFFTITNIGKDETRILVRDLSMGGCTSVGAPKQKLAPGEAVQLEFIFETLGYGGRSPTRRIQVHYNNPKLSPLELSVRAKILPPEPYEVPIGELLYNFLVLIDVRSHEDFAKEHIAGAINVPQEKLSEWASKLSKDILIYLYSEDGTESDEAAQSLRKEGFSQCLSLVGGLREWKLRYSNRYLISGSM